MRRELHQVHGESGLRLRHVVEHGERVGPRECSNGRLVQFLLPTSDADRCREQEKSKTVSDWDQLFQTLQAADAAHDRERSIHNCVQYYNHSRPWISHVSLQGHDVQQLDMAKATWTQHTPKPIVWVSRHDTAVIWVAFFQMPAISLRTGRGDVRRQHHVRVGRPERVHGDAARLDRFHQSSRDGGPLQHGPAAEVL